MKTKFLFIALAISLPMKLHAYAYLDVSADDGQLGQVCYSSSVETLYDFTLKKYGPISAYQEYEYFTGDYSLSPGNYDECPGGTYESDLYEYQNGCLVGENDGFFYVCDVVPDNSSDLCEWGAGAYEMNYWQGSDWQLVSGNMVRMPHISAESSYDEYSCTIDSVDVYYDYGCVAGYYPGSGSGANIVCAPCPDGGTSHDGTMDIGECFIAPGTHTFSDEVGIGEITVSDQGAQEDDYGNRVCFWEQ